MGRLAIEDRRVRVVPEAATDRFAAADPTATAEVLRRYDLKQGYILYVGGFDSKKDVATLIRARALLPREAPCFVLAGSLSGGGPDMVQLAAELGITS
jgi:glycosyltransferase involved in cell wall biosynthesis